MQIRNINKVLYTSGGTSDIIRVVMMAYDIERDPQIYEIAERLKGSTVVETCRNIWQYLVDTIDYAADSDGNGGEMVRTPARLIHDRTGDCKSYSLFTAVVLRYLNIPHVFRFVSYNGRKEATHVYVVAFDNNREVVIDAVAKEQLNYPFGYEKKYSYKCDMANGGTKISYLAGLTPGVTGSKKRKRIGNIAFNLGTPISGSAIRIIDQSLERLQAGYDANPTDYNREQLNVSKLLVHAATTNNLDAYKVSRSLYGIAYLSANGSLSSDYDTVRSEFDSIDYNNVSESNIDNELLVKLQNIVLEQKKNSINGIGMTDSYREKRLAVKLDWAAALYFFIWFYTDDDITAKFQNSTELLKKKKYVGIFIKVFYDRQEWHQSKLMERCRVLIESKFGMKIEALKQKIESGNLGMPTIAQEILENTMDLENLFDIWFYPIGNGVIDLNKDMIKNVIPLDDYEDEDSDTNSETDTNSGTDNNSDSGSGDTEKKSNTGLLLGTSLSAFLLLR